MRILVSGSHGLVGKALIRSLTSDGHEIVRLVRGKPSGATEIEWHPNQEKIDAAALEGVDAVVHLAGESIATAGWTAEKKFVMRDSGVKGTTFWGQALAQLSRPPQVFVSASAIGY